MPRRISVDKIMSERERRQQARGKIKIVTLPLIRLYVNIYSYVCSELPRVIQGCDYSVHCFTAERSC
jgi:hypothetical protein